MTQTLHLRAAGMVTPVGLDAPSSCAAMRARLDGFSETRFIGPGGGWLIGAPVPLPRNWTGQVRMARLLAGAIVEIFRKVPEAEGTAALVLCVGEETRPGRPVRDTAELVRQVTDITGLPHSTRIQVVAHGRPSGFVALMQARRLMAEGAPSVIVAGVDSYLTTLSVAHYLAEGRLLTGANANGFIPGEAAAAILCTKGGGALALTGLGLAREAAFIYNGQGDEPGHHRPLRGDGMTQAYRLALDEANVDLARVDYRISDLIGESYWFKQSALAHMRLERGRKEFQDIWSPAENVGNVGAAVVPMMLGMALAAAQKGYAMGSPVLVEASGDDGACGAAVLHDVRAG
jgi:3-oxoacyl-[acyl-carrier-protein] synthase-1